MARAHIFCVDYFKLSNEKRPLPYSNEKELRENVISECFLRHKNEVLLENGARTYFPRSTLFLFSFPEINFLLPATKHVLAPF